MQEATFDLQTITPLFLAGAEYSFIPIREKRQQEKGGRRTFATHGWDLQAEIRPPSFRGLMRYWLRAVVGGLIDTTTVSLNEVIQFEQSVFGATDQGSAITVRIANAPEKARRFRKESFSQEDVTGRDYLLWSMAESGYGQNYKPDRLYYPEGSRFKVILSERDVDPTAPQALPYAVAALWLLTSLGGIGSRSHRCAGSLMIEQVIGNTPNLPFTKAKKKEDLQASLRQGILEIRRLSVFHLQELKKQGVSIPFTKPSFDSLLLPRVGASSPPLLGCRIWILTQKSGLPWESLKDAMNEIGTQLKKCRSTLSVEERTTFGLPLNVSLPADRKLEKTLRDSRRASPLLLRITQLSNGKYVGVAVLFKTPALPIIDSDNKRPLIPAPDYTVIEKWIDSFQGRLEVEL